MTSDEIAKLHQLHKEGALTEAEYEAQKQALLGKAAAKPAKKKWPLWLKLVLAVIGLVGLINTVTSMSPSDSLAEVPKCGASDAKAAMKDAIEHNAAANQATLRLLDLTDTKEVSYAAQKKERVCEGTAFLNSGQVHVHYRLWLTSNNRLLIEVN